MPRLYEWYISKHSLDYYLARGIVTGHSKIEDSTPIHTSVIQDFIVTDEEKGEALIITQNTEYKVKLCHLNKKLMQDFKKEIDADNIPFDWIRRAIDFTDKYVHIEEKHIANKNSILLVLGNNKLYYFDSMIVNNGVDQLENKQVFPHIGMMQDSVLCMATGKEQVYDIRYFTYKDNNIEFYSWNTQDLDVYIKNVGDAKLRVRLGNDVYVINPDSTLLINKENKSDEKLTSEADLYTSW